MAVTKNDVVKWLRKEFRGLQGDKSDVGRLTFKTIYKTLNKAARLR